MNKLRAVDLLEGGMLWFLFFLPLNEVAMLLGLVTAWGAFAWRYHKGEISRPVLSREAYIFLALSLTSFVTAAFSPIAAKSLLFAFNLFLTAVLGFIFFQALDLDSQKLRRYSHAFLYGVTVLTIYEMGRHYYLYGIEFSEHRLGYSAYLSLFTAVALPWVFSIALAARGKLRIFYVGWFLFLALALVLTFGRGAWLGAICGLFMVSLSRGRKTALVFLFCLIIGVTAIFPLIKERARDMVNPNTRSNAQRIIGWKTALRMTGRYPLRGVGFANFKESYWSEEFRPEGAKAKLSHAHNIFLHIYAEQGVLVGTLFLILTVTISIRALKLARVSDGSRGVYPGMGAALLSLLVLGQFAGSMLICLRIWFLFCFTGAVLSATPLTDKGSPV